MTQKIVDGEYLNDVEHPIIAEYFKFLFHQLLL